FELTGPEDEVSRRDLVTERLADLTDTEGRLLTHGGQHIEEVDKDSLRRLRPQIVQPLVRLHRAEMRFEHHVEIARLGVITTRAAVRAGNIGQVVHISRFTGALGVLLSQLVGTEPSVAGTALDQWVVERCGMTGRLPDLPWQYHRGIQTHYVLSTLDHRLPPLSLQVVLQFHSERAVVPGRAGTAVDFTTRKHEATTFAEIDDGIDGVCRHCTLRERGGTTGLTAQDIRPIDPDHTGTRARTVT